MVEETTLEFNKHIKAENIVSNNKTIQNALKMVLMHLQVVNDWPMYAQIHINVKFFLFSFFTLCIMNANFFTNDKYFVS